MTRHGKNSTANSVYSYHERVKDKKLSGWGTLHSRLGKDSIKDFDCCSLTLQPCADPVVTKDGHLFDKLAILEYIVHRKKENSRKLKAWEKQQQETQQEAEKTEDDIRMEKLQKFINHEATPTVSHDHDGDDVFPTTSMAAFSNRGSKKGSICNMAGQKRKQMPSFWTPDQQPLAKATKVEKPDQKVYCPLSGKPLKVKDLIPVKFTPMPTDDTRADVAKQVRYMCAVSRDALTNSVRAAVLRTSGTVVSLDTVNRIIRKDWTDPITGELITEEDIIELQRGGTGYSTVNEEKLSAKAIGPSAISA